MKKFGLLLLILFAIFVAGCTTKANGPENQNTAGDEIDKGDERIIDSQSMTGYIMDKEDGRILVVDDKAQDFSSTGGIKEFYNAIWFSNAPDELKEGDYVKVWFDVVRESYPGQSEAIKVEIIESERPAGANLTKSEALNRLLTSGEFTEGLYTVKSIEYNQNDGLWTITLKDIFSEAEGQSFTVEDN